MLERIGLVLITPWSAIVIRTKYEVHYFCCKFTHIVQLLRQEEEIYCLV